MVHMLNLKSHATVYYTHALVLSTAITLMHMSAFALSAERLFCRHVTSKSTHTRTAPDRKSTSYAYACMRKQVKFFIQDNDKELRTTSEPTAAFVIPTLPPASLLLRQKSAASSLKTFRAPHSLDCITATTLQLPVNTAGGTMT